MPKSDKIIDVGKDFSRYPAGRTAKDGEYSGQNFVRKLLFPALKAGGLVEIYLDGALSYGSSFLEETFAGLIRDQVITPKEFRERIKFVSDDPFLLAEIDGYVDDEIKRIADERG